MNGSRWRAGLLLALTFAAGAAVGIAGDRLELIPSVARATEADEEGATPARRSEGRSRTDGPSPPPPREGRTTIERFADDLGLTSEQRAEIETILDEYRASAKELQESVEPRYRSLIDSVRTRIESVLTGDQVDQYRSLLERRGRREGWGRQDDGDDDGDASHRGRRDE